MIKASFTFVLQTYDTSDQLDKYKDSPVSKPAFFGNLASEYPMSALLYWQ